MLSCYSSKQSLIIMFLGIIAILISIVKYYNFKLVAVQAIIYYLLAFQTQCLITGNCNLSSWFVIILPSIAIIIFILDYLKYFESVKDKTKKIYSSINFLNNSNLQKIIEKELTK